MAVRRGIVQGYDSGLAQPKGVAGAIDVRQSVAALAQRSGVYWDRVDPCTASGTATMDVDITSFRAAIESPLGGYYVVTVDEDASVAIAASDSTNDRYDIIYVNQEDYQVDGALVDSEAVLEVATGTPALTPVDPDIPDGALALYRVEVPAGVTTTDAVGVVITPLFDYTAPVGAPLTVNLAADLADVVGPYGGMRALDKATGDTWKYVSGQWVVWERVADFTPSLTGVTIGNGTALGRYQILGGRLVIVRLVVVLGSSSSVSGAVLDLPTGTIDNSASSTILGNINLVDGSSIYPAAFSYGSTTAIGFGAQVAGGTYVTRTPVTNLVPFTWGNGDRISGTVAYSSATWITT